MHEVDAGLIWCPFADEETAAHVAGILLDEGHIACANIMPGVRSLYVWNGERGESREVVAVFKTAAERLAGAIARLEMLHPYDSPAICGWLCDSAGTSTRRWLGQLATPSAGT